MAKTFMLLVKNSVAKKKLNAFFSNYIAWKIRLNWIKQV